MSDRVRVLRIIQYEGEREWVEATVARSIHGRVDLPRGTITAVTLHEFPQVVDEATVDEVLEPEPGFTADERGWMERRLRSLRVDELGLRMPGQIGGKR
jgi:hypothetical protein